MKYIIYCRKSSEAEDRQVLSIKAQLNELQKLAKRENLKIEKVYTESMSAHSPGRFVFNEMIEYIQKNPGIGILVWKLDRLSRNSLDGGRLVWMIDTREISEIKTFEKTYKNTSDDKFIMNIDFGMSKKFSDDLSINVKRGNRAKLESGGWPNHAPLGYLNNKAENTIIVDRKMSKYVIRIFELCATGKYSIREIVDILYEEGFRTKSGKKVYKATIHRILNKSFYYGVMERNGEYYKGNHKPLISKELFDKAQEALQERNRPKRKKIFFPYRGLINCPCGCVYTASKKKGYDYYYCTNGKNNCEAHKSYTKSEIIDELMAKELTKIGFDEELIEICYEANKVKNVSKEEYQDNIKDSLEKELLNLDIKKEKLLDIYLSNSIEKDLCEAKIRQLKKDKIDIESQILDLKKKYKDPLETLEQVKNVFLTASRAKKKFIESSPEKKRDLLETVLWNIEVKDKKIACSRFKEPYNILANTPKNCDFQKMLGDRDSNPDCLDQNQMSYH